MWKLVEGDRAAKTAAGSKERAVAAAAAAGVSVWVPVLRCAALRYAALRAVVCRVHMPAAAAAAVKMIDRQTQFAQVASLSCKFRVA